jgi:hypothetical protein
VLCLKSSIFLTPCGLVEVYERFGGVYCLLLQGQRVSQTSSNWSGFTWLVAAAADETVCSSGTFVNLTYICFSRTRILGCEG